MNCTNDINLLFFYFLISAFVFFQVVKPECTGTTNNHIHVQKRETLKNGKKLLANGINEAYPNSPEITTIVTKLVSKLASESESNCTQEVNKVLNATTQMVTGKLITLTMEICSQNCLNSTNDCDVCTARVWQKAWEGKFDVREFHCNNVNIKTSKAKVFEFDIFH